MLLFQLKRLFKSRNQITFQASAVQLGINIFYIMGYSVFTHLAYSEWANTKFADLLLTVDDVLYHQPNKCSFPSIAKTVLHINDAQLVWLSRLKGQGLSSWPSENFRGGKSDALAWLVESWKELTSFITSKGEAFLQTRYAYKSMKGDPFEDPVEDTLFHIVNHGTYHRGQIVMMLREMNITKVVSTDLIHYLRTLK